jgi:hypothetical protein
MDDKAHILTAKLNRNIGVWAIDVTAYLAIGGQVVTATAVPAIDTSQPAGGWRPIIAAAVAQAAFDQQETVVDEVMFMDLTSVSI